MALKKWVLIGVSLLLLASLLAPPSSASATEEAQSIKVSAVNAVLMEQKSGRVLFEKKAHQRKRIASITKIMTAIIAIESGKLNDTVSISEQAVRAEGSSLFLKPGQKMKLEDLVYGLMLRSGNDAATAIAEHVGGSVEGFALLMNQKAEELGMKDSSFTNPHGLDNTENHYSSAYDMALLTRYAMDNRTYAKIAGTKIHRAPNTEEAWDYSWKNKNKMLTLYKYSTGGKTGFTKLARRTLVSTAQKDGMDLIAVTLNDGDDWKDHMNLFEYGFKQYTLTQVLRPGYVKGIQSKFYRKKVVLKRPFYYPLTADEQDRVTAEIKLVKPGRNWSNKDNIPPIVGKAIVELNGEPIGSRNIFFKGLEPKRKTSFLEEWKHAFLMLLDLNRHG
ncbi:D-alanyl-D-alanine carboxypeptidase family protein [Bacillus testis]|uniref:D-alanyl-D-alanine carboxypeptidase family protein n=1 Tax=Bacillus testis TaxID=1622072 RepID=UPI00067EDA82|nr:D-alanyl-D-alanine carboxypeptidase family protein [Bacillus testis]